MKQTLIRMTRDIIMLIVPAIAFMFYVAGWLATQQQWCAGIFAAGGALVGMTVVAVFEKAAR